MNKITRQSLWTALKLTTAGTTLVLIAIAIVTFYPTTGVKKSEADISWGTTFTRSSTQKFTTTLDKLGHPAPRSYDYNGNTVFFSARTTRQSPREAMLEYQQAFTKAGINERPYLELLSAKTGPKLDPQEQLEQVATGPAMAMLSAQIVPTAISSNYVLMGGGLIKGEPTTTAAATKIVDEHLRAKKGFDSLFQGYRGIEISRDEGDDLTHITASWSDGDFDIKKHLPTPEGQFPVAANPDSEVPSCPGCERITRFAGEGPESQYVSNVFDSPQSPAAAMNFYIESMKNRGWQETESSEMTRRALEYTTLRDLPTQAVQLARGEEFITVSVNPSGNGSLITTTTAQ